MLSFQEKLDICSSFPELERKDVSLGRVNFSYEESAHDKKTVVYHLHPNGNGFVYAGLISGASTDDKGMVNIREAGAAELRELIGKSIRSLSHQEEREAPAPSKNSRKASNAKEQIWTGPDNQTLQVRFEDELWYIYAGVNLESAFETFEEAEEYLKEEGFKRT
jgi:hypothetical protein